MLTYEQAREVHKSLSTDKVVYPLMRRFAANHLSENGWPEGEGMGTSDISIALTSLIQHFELPLIGPVCEAYADCGIEVPEQL